MILYFTKMHGAGNDFVMIDLVSQRGRLRRVLAEERLHCGGGPGVQPLLTQRCGHVQEGLPDQRVAEFVSGFPLAGGGKDQVGRFRFFDTIEYRILVRFQCFLQHIRFEAQTENGCHDEEFPRFHSQYFKPLFDAPWFAVPDFVFPEWNLQAIFFIVPVAIAPAIEHFGDILAIGSVTGRDYVKNPGIHRTMLGDGMP